MPGAVRFGFPKAVGYRVSIVSKKQGRRRAGAAAVIGFTCLPERLLDADGRLACYRFQQPEVFAEPLELLPLLRSLFGGKQL